MSKVLNPYTGRYIQSGGATHKKLMRSQWGGGPFTTMARGANSLGDKYDMAKANKNREAILGGLNKETLKMFIEQAIEDRKKMLNMLADPKAARQLEIMKKIGLDVQNEIVNLVNFETEIMAQLAFQDLDDNDNKWLQSLYKK